MSSDEPIRQQPLIATVSPQAARTVVNVEGEACYPTSAPLDQALQSALAAPARVVDIDFSHVTFCDCHALNTLLRARCQAARAGAHLTLRPTLQPVVHRLLTLTGAAPLLSGERPHAA
ncbi:STAS domain-containing protein [Streptomyces sp. NPDC046860]|uniref:STAS domain-containing protein n=1 Tax=Streptomyces sp. NPDC046860 TaxID=3154495 RepID=UPI00340A1564